MATMANQRSYVARETAISVVINVALSLFFTWLAFGGESFAPRDAVLVDFAPQTFMIALMGSLIPAAITRGKVRKGAVLPLAGSAGRLPRNLLLRSLLIAVLVTVVVGGLAVAVTLASGVETFPFGPLMVGKALYGALVALFVTPIAVRMALRDGRAGE